MARGRHRRPSLLSRLVPGRAARLRREAELVRRDRVLLGLHGEVDRLRSVGTTLANRAAQADVRARRAQAEAQAATALVRELRTELAALREELLWAWSEQRLAAEAAGAPRVIDLRDSTRTA